MMNTAFPGETFAVSAPETMPIPETMPLVARPRPMLFPGMSQPFQCVELRDRHLAADVWSGGRRVAMAVLQPQWKTNHESEFAPLQAVVCVGHVVLEAKRGDGRDRLLLRGLRRARIVSEQAGAAPYRVGSVVELPDLEFGHEAQGREERRLEILRLLPGEFPGLASHPSLNHLVHEDVLLGTLCDFVAFSMQLPPADLYAVLAEPNVDLRSALVLDRLRGREEFRRAAMAPKSFSVAFSAN